MSEAHPDRYVVTAYRNNFPAHLQEAATHDEALRLKAQFEAVPHTDVEIEIVHDPAATDLTTHTREIVEDIGRKAQ